MKEFATLTAEGKKYTSSDERRVYSVLIYKFSFEIKISIQSRFGPKY